jgi:hypothetical protein
MGGGEHYHPLHLPEFHRAHHVLGKKGALHGHGIRGIGADHLLQAVVELPQALRQLARRRNGPVDHVHQSPLFLLYNPVTHDQGAGVYPQYPHLPSCSITVSWMSKFA